MADAPALQNIPPAPATRRQITKNVKVVYRGPGCVEAFWGKLDVRPRPHEIEALDMLLAYFGQHMSDEEHLYVRAVLAALRAAPAKPTREEWPFCPLGLRGPKPRRPRKEWTDPTTGKTVRIYADTMQRHADPQCPCEYDTNIRAQRETPEE